jgi:hypothetical protein
VPSINGIITADKGEKGKEEGEEGKEEGEEGEEGRRREKEAHTFEAINSGSTCLPEAGL